MTLERSSSWWSSDLALRDFKFKGKRGWRSNQHVRRRNEHWFSADDEEEWWTQCGDLSATNKQILFPHCPPDGPDWELVYDRWSTPWRTWRHRHRDVEVSFKILKERLGIFVAGACFFSHTICWLRRRNKCRKTGISWIQLKISSWNAFSQVFTPLPHSQWNQKGYIDTRPQCAFLRNIWKNQVRCI